MVGLCRLSQGAHRAGGFCTQLPPAEAGRNPESCLCTALARAPVPKLSASGLVPLLLQNPENPVSSRSSLLLSWTRPCLLCSARLSSGITLRNEHSRDISVCAGDGQYGSYSSGLVLPLLMVCSSRSSAPCCQGPMSLLGLLLLRSRELLRGAGLASGQLSASRHRCP